jgi:hypothetical protein
MTRKGNWTLLLLGGCTASNDLLMSPTDVVVPCLELASGAVDVRIWWPDPVRTGSPPALVYRVGGADSDGYEINFGTSGLLMNGVGVIQHLAPINEDFWRTDEQAAIACVVDYIRGVPAEIGEVPSLTITGLSLGGNTVLNSVIDRALDVDGVVLWESPLVDELILLETSPEMMVDPTLVEGGCTLDAGCLFDGRAARLGFDAVTGQLFVDADEDGKHDEEEAYYHREVADGGYAYSRELTSLAQSLFFEESTLPTGWISGAQLDEFWSAKDATEALISVRDNGSKVPFTYVTAQIDHVQLVQEHILLAIEGLSGSDHFLVNDATASDIDLATLPNESASTLVLSAELAMVDTLTLE